MKMSDWLFFFLVFHPSSGSDTLTLVSPPQRGHSLNRSPNVSDPNVPNTQLIVDTAGKLSHTLMFPNIS